MNGLSVGGKGAGIVTVHEAIRKGLLSENLEKQYSAVFAKCVEWFAPTNKRDDEYSLAQALHTIGLLDMRRTSKHRAGCFRGHRVEFKQSASAADGEAVQATILSVGAQP